MGNSSSSSNYNDEEFQSILPNDVMNETSNIIEVVEMTTDNVTNDNNNLNNMNKLDIDIKDIKQLTDQFDFDLTEGQIRRGNMTDCEYECSEIFDYLYVGGSKVAESWDTLVKYNITRVINCSLAVVKNHFADKDNMIYLGLNMVDGREDDITWFICQVINFIIESKRLNQKTLIHCEKGVSRSCSFAIAYYMWKSNVPWKQSFDYVKSKRRVCAPNTAFTCNLIEFGELLHSSLRQETFYFRCASHLPHDPNTPVLKLCRDPQTRRILNDPTTSDLSPDGVFVVKPSERSNDTTLYVWKGSKSPEQASVVALMLAEGMVRIFKNFKGVQLVTEGCEPESFLLIVQRTGIPFINDNQAIIYKDLYLIEMNNVNNNDNINSMNNSEMSILGEVGPLQPYNKRKEPCEDKVPKLSTPPVFFVSGSPEIVDKSAEKRRALKDNQPSLPSLTISGFKLGDIKSTTIDSMMKNTNKMSSITSIKTSSSTSGIALIANDPNEARIPSMPLSSKLRTPPPSDVNKRPVHSGVKLITPPPSITILENEQSSSSRSPAMITKIELTPKTPTPPLMSKLSLKSSTPPLIGLPSTRPTSASKIPDAVDLARDATPVQELAKSAPPISAFTITTEHDNHTSAKVARSTKPKLYQAIPFYNDSNAGYTLKWEAMGVYDDDDLSEDSIMLLACPMLPHYLWIGSGVEEFSLDSSDDFIKSWLSANVYKGDLDKESAQGANVTEPGALEIEFSGNESDDFWNMFNEGF